MSIPQSPRVFISYARSDGEEFAARLRQRLEREQPEITLWQDRARMEGGKDWWNQILEALDQVQFMVLVMTPASQQSAMVRKEWRAARERGVCIYPVVASPDLDFKALPRWMSKTHFYHLDKEWETFTNYLKSPCTAARVPFMADDLPEKYIDRTQILALLRVSLLDGENPAPGTVVLHGPGGFGKTTLAQAVCHDDDILTTYDAGVLWVTLGEHPNVLNELTKLYAALTDERPAFVDVEDAAAHVAERLGESSCLLVIDDVWNEAHLRPFLRGGSGCARLITTRQFEVAAEAPKPIEVYEMTPDEAVNMLTARLDQPPSDRQPFQQLARRLGEWPLMLELAGAMLRQRMLKGDTPQGAVQYLNTALDKRGATAFDRTTAEARNQAIAKSLTVSLDQLEPVERQRYVELAIFPDDVDVPLSTLQALWGLDDFDAEETVERLSDLSLLRYDLPSGTIRMHDVVRSYIASQLSSPPSVHARLLDAWGDPHRLPHDYAWRWIAYHLEEAGRKDQLRSLLLDYDWLQAKLDATDVTALLKDFDYLPDDLELRLVHEAIKRSTQILQQDHTQLAGQLLGRLLSRDEPTIRSLLKGASQWAGSPWLRPLTRTLTPPGDPLLFTLSGHEGKVRSMAITPDGRWGITASNSQPDRTVRLWNLGTGIELHTLADQADAGGFNPLGLTPDGRHALYARKSDIHVWNMATGEQNLILQGHESQITALAVATEGKWAISAAIDGKLIVWDLVNWNRCTKLPGHQESVHAVSITPNGRVAVSVSAGALKLWDLERQLETSMLQGETGFSEAWHRPPLALSPDGREVFFGDPLRIWHTDDNDVRPVFDTVIPGRVLSITPDGRIALTTQDDQTIDVWDVEHMARLVTLPGQGSPIATLAITPDGMTAVTALDNHYIKVWALEYRAVSVASPRPANTVDVTRDGQWVVSIERGEIVDVWDLKDGQRVPPSPLRDSVVQDMRSLWGERAERYAKANDLTKRYSAKSSRADNMSEVWSPIFQDYWIVVATDGKRVFSRFRRRGKTSEAEETGGHVDRYAIKVSTFDAPNEPLMILYGHSSPVMVVAMTPDGRRAVSGCVGRTLRVWDLEAGKELQPPSPLRGHRGIIWDVKVMTPDGQYAVSASEDRTIRVWNLHTGQNVATFTGQLPMKSCAVDQGGRSIVACDSLGEVHFLRLEGLGR